MTFAFLSVGLAFPFSAGLVAAFNPCGFAMLPTYLAFFMGQEDKDAEPSVLRSITRGLTVGLTLSAGFFLVFGSLGLIARQVLSTGAIAERSPWVTLVLGILMVPVGIAMIAGFEPNLSSPRLNKGGGSSDLGSIFMFGVSYAIVSFGCTAPLFIGTVASTFTNDGFVDGIATFLAYAAGMAAVVVFLTMAVALAQGAIAGKMRQFLPYVNRVSGVLLFFGGIYIALYGWWEIQVFRGNEVGTNWAQRQVEDLQGWITTTIANIGAGRVGLGILAIIGAAVLLAVVTSKSSSANDLGSDTGTPSSEDKAESTKVS